MLKTENKSLKGSVTPALLIIMGTFLVVIYAILALIALQLDFVQRQLASDSALHIAESGINYYLWHLREDPEDYQDGTGAEGPYQHTYTDVQGNVIGSYSLEIIPPAENSTIVEIHSTGWTDKYPNITRKIHAKFGKTPLTRFAFLHNSTVWFGNEVTVNGPVFTNGAIRQDGINTSSLKSSKETYICGIETGCTQPTEKPAIWGSGGPQELWEFPVTPVDFESISINFNSMKQIAQTSGVYLPPSGEQGYKLVFKANGNIDIFRVLNTDFYKGYSREFGCENLYQIIENEEYIQEVEIADSSIIFVEDDVWVEGVVNGKTTVIAARFPLDTNNADVWILNDLTYLEKTPDHKLGIISQKDIILGKDVPDEFEIEAAMLAQKGRIIRHHYNYFKCKNPGGDKTKQSLTIYGSLISNLSSYWNFSGGPQSPASGFQSTTINFDSNLHSNPPEYFPEYGDYELIYWAEE